ncbi:microtubule-associated protein futsch-like [Branchiostoma lanceolatum]|uniref:microtubule-associated protein futsch-like n=1 Tax=Branchiostoma lanceolatum TaxID=7740 RepID=UPI00345613D7
MGAGVMHDTPTRIVPILTEGVVVKTPAPPSRPASARSGVSMASRASSAHLQEFQQRRESLQREQEEIAKARFIGRGHSAVGVRWAAHDLGEAPERATPLVVAAYMAMEEEEGELQKVYVPNLVQQSLEQFMETTDRHRPPSGLPDGRAPTRVKGSTKAVRLQTAPDSTTQGRTRLNRDRRKPNVRFKQVVTMMDRVSRKMDVEREKLSPAPRYGWKYPSTHIQPSRPKTAPVIMTAPGRPPSPSSTYVSPDHSNMTTPREFVMPFIDWRGQITPQAYKYSWRSDGLGGHTYVQKVRKQRGKMKSTGGAYAGKRPKTAPEVSVKERWKTYSEKDQNVRIPQAASHETTTINQVAVSQLVQVQHLGEQTTTAGVSRIKKRVTLPWEEEDDPSPGTMEYMKFSKPMKLSGPRPVSGRGSAGPQTSRVTTPLPPPGEAGLEREEGTMSDSLDPSQILPMGSMLDHLSASFHDDGRSFSRTKTESERQDRSTYKDSFSDQSIPLSDNNSQRLSDDDNDSQKLSEDEDEPVEGDEKDRYDADRDKDREEKQESDSKDDRSKVLVVSIPEEEERSESGSETAGENTVESGSTTDDEEDRTDIEHEPTPQQRSDSRAEGFGSLLGVIREESIGEKGETYSPPQTAELAGLRMDRSDSRQDSASDEIIFTKGQFLATGIFEPDLEPKVSRVIPSPRPKSAQSATSSPGGGRQSRQSSRSAKSGSKPSSASAKSRVMSEFDEDEDLGIFDDNGSSESASKSGESTPGQPVIIISGQRKRPKSSYGHRLRADPSPDKTPSQTPKDSRPESPTNTLEEQSDQESDTESSAAEKPQTGSPKPVQKTKHVDQSIERRTQGGRPIPMYGAPPEYDQLQQAVKRQQETKAAVDIQRIFRGYRVRNYYKNFLHKLEETDKKETALHIQREHRQHRARLRNIEAQPGKLREETEQFAQQYEEDAKNKMFEKQKRWERDKQQLLDENREAAAMIARIGPHVEMYEAFHPKRTGPTKAEVKKAAICIQRHIRGWLVRKRYHRLQDKAKRHTNSFSTCVKMYRQMLNRIMTRHGVNRPTIPLVYSQLEEFLDRKNKYEKMFNKRQFWNEIEVSELPAYFKDCEHFPSEREINEAWDIVTKGTPANVGHALKKKEVVEVAFQIYVPSGTGLTQQETRRSTWLNPIVNGLEGNKYMGSEQVEETDYKTCAGVVQKAYRERKKRLTAEGKQKTNGEPPQSTNGSSAGSERTNESRGEKKVRIVEPSEEDEDSVTHSEDQDEEITSDNGVLDS